MEQRISIITLGVEDLKRSTEFYERLGWRRSKASSEGITFFQAGGMALALYPRSELAKDANVTPHGDGFRATSLALNTRSRDEVDSVLKEAGRRSSSLRRKLSGADTRATSLIQMDFCGRLHGVHFSPSLKTEVCGFLNKSAVSAADRFH